MAIGSNSGKKLWSVKVDGPIRGEPVITKSYIFVQTQQGTLYAIGSKAEI